MTKELQKDYSEFYSLPDWEKSAVVTINFWRSGENKPIIEIPPGEEDKIRRGFYGRPSYPVDVVGEKIVYELPPSPAVERKETPLFSYFNAPVSNTLPSREITLWQCAQMIELPWPLSEKTAIMRSLVSVADQKRYKAQKFPYVTFSGTFSSRRAGSILRHSGMVVLDLDHLEIPEKVKMDLQYDPVLEPALIYTSVSGKGLKVVVPVDITQCSHSDCFDAASAYLSQKYKLEADPSGRDVCRASFLCYDPSVYLNPLYND